MSERPRAELPAAVAAETAGIEAGALASQVGWTRAGCAVAFPVGALVLFGLWTLLTPSHDAGFITDPDSAGNRPQDPDFMFTPPPATPVPTPTASPQYGPAY